MTEIFKRVGRFYIAKTMIGESPEAIQAIFSKVIPIKAEFFMHSDRLEYYAYSYDFAILEEGTLVPAYTACVEKRKDSKGQHYYHVWWKNTKESSKIEQRVSAYYRDKT